jgi:hypothetical protein
MQPYIAYLMLVRHDAERRRAKPTKPAPRTKP